jgi:hypothetical protein
MLSLYNGNRLSGEIKCAEGWVRRTRLSDYAYSLCASCILEMQRPNPAIHFALHCHLQSSLTIRKEKERSSRAACNTLYSDIYLICICFVLFYDCYCWFSKHRSGVVDTGDNGRNVAVKILYTEKTNSDFPFNP